jgi:hypothetical protein
MKNILNTLDVECLIQSLGEYIEARNQHEKEYNEYDGMSWGYHGGGEYGPIARLERCAEDFASRLNAYVDSRIEAKLIEKNL